MNKSILVDAYLLTKKNGSYSLSFRKWMGDQSDPLPMLFVRTVDIDDTEHYLYKVDVNQAVSVQEYGHNTIFSFTVMYEGSLQDGSFAYLQRQQTHLDCIIDADGKITMSRHLPEDIHVPVGERSLLFRFADPLIVVDNV